jgi:hypothetical protein
MLGTTLNVEIERAAPSEYAKVLVEYKKRFPDGVDDRLGKRSGIPVFDKWLTIGHNAPLADRMPRAVTATAFANGDFGISLRIEHKNDHGPSYRA